MSRRLTDEQRIENFFSACDPKAAELMLSRIALIMRVRKLPEPAPKLGRPRKPKAKPPIALGEAVS